MKATIFVGTSLDGFIARADGTFDFLPPSGGEPHGYEEFMATVTERLRRSARVAARAKAWQRGARYDWL